MNKSIVSVVLIIEVMSSLLFSQSTLTQFPKQLQLYGRDAQDSAAVVVAGSVQTAGLDSVSVRLFKNNVLVLRLSRKLQYADGSALFSFSPKIHAELSMYRIELYAGAVLSASADSLVAGDAYLLDGQSNAQHVGNGESANGSPFERRFGVRDEIASCTTWVTTMDAGGGNIIAMNIIKNHFIPVCIFNGALGGTSIEEHYQGHDLTTIYGKYYYRITKAGLANHVKAVIWHQGETVWGEADQYKSKFLGLCSSWKSDFPGITHYYIFQLRPARGDIVIREQQRQIGIGRGDISVIATTHVPCFDGLHFYGVPGSDSGYLRLGNDVYSLIARDFYGSIDTMNIRSPDIIKAWFCNQDRTVVQLQFDGPVLLPASTSSQDTLKTQFAMGGEWGVKSMKADTARNRLTLFLSHPADTTTISYIGSYYANTQQFYNGPWLLNPRGIGALTFYNFPVSGTDTNPGKGYLYVKLLDSVTYQYIKTAAAVELFKDGSSVSVLTDSTGFMEMKVDSGGGYTVNVSARGYLPKAGVSVGYAGGESGFSLVISCTRQPLAGIEIQGDTTVMYSNSEKSFVLYGIYSDGARMLLYSGVVLAWTSLSPDLVSVSGSGVAVSSAQTGVGVVAASFPSLGLSDSVRVRVILPYWAPLYHWKLDEMSGNTASDATGNGDTAVLYGAPVWDAGKYGNALSFDGVDDYLSTAILQKNPNVFTLSLWFKNTSTTGGKLIGLGDAQTGTSGSYDRHLYMDNAGKIYFGCHNGGVQTISTTLGYNDGNWHHAAATLSVAGMMLYADGILAASNTNVTSAENYNGYWKMGFDNLAGWTNAPSSDYFSGQLDDIRVYDMALSASDIALLMNDTTTYPIGTTTDISSGLTVPENLSLVVSPNPFNPNLNIKVFGLKSGTDLRILSVNGKVVADLTSVLNSAMTGKGVRQVTWNADGHASGVYLVLLRQGNVELKRKIVLMR